MGEVRVEAASAAWLPRVAEMASRAFLASPVFAGVDEARYVPTRILASLTLGECLVAHHEGKIAGCVCLFPPKPDSPCDAFRSRPQIGLLAVDPAHQGTGVARLLLDSAETRGIAAGHHEVALSVTERSPELVALYRRRGYAVAGTFLWPGARDPSQILVKSVGKPRADRPEK